MLYWLKFSLTFYNNTRIKKNREKEMWKRKLTIQYKTEYPLIRGFLKRVSNITPLHRVEVESLSHSLSLSLSLFVFFMMCSNSKCVYVLDYLTFVSPIKCYVYRLSCIHCVLFKCNRHLFIKSSKILNYRWMRERHTHKSHRNIWCCD